MFHFWCTICLWLLLTVAMPISAFAQSTQRPKVGLALGGGSALGIAHAGVLEWLEEHRIPVDYIAGTSMGGLVAGAYATGMTSAEIREMLEGQDWNTTLASGTPYTTLTFRRKQDRRDYPSEIQLGLKKGVHLPSALNPAPEVSLLLSRIAARVGPVDDFANLPIPFRCVAVDLRNGDAVVLSRGSLASALRATMAIPALFTPVELEGKLLVDGGVVDNVPADVARTMGADVVIAVDVGNPFARQEVFNDLLGVLGRTIDILTRQPNEQGIATADLILRPDLKPYTIVDWAAGPELIKRGRAAAEANKEKLLPLALSEEDWKAYLAARQARIPTGTFTPQFFEVLGTNSRQAAVLRGRLEALAGNPLDIEKLENILSLSSGNGFFDSLTYAPIQKDGRSGIRIIAIEKPYAPPTLNFAPIISSDRARDVTTLLTGRITLFDFGITNSETRVDVGIGTTQNYAAEYFVPFSRLLAQWKSEVFIAPRAYYNHDQQSFFDRGTRVADYLIRSYGAGVDIGLIGGRNNEVRLGWEQGHQEANVLVGAEGTPTLSGGTRLLRLRYTYDGQDAPVLPRRGLRVISDFEHIYRAPGAGSTYNRIEVNASWFKPNSVRDTQFFGASFGLLTSDNTSPLSEFTLGGTLRLSAYQPGERAGRRYYYGTAGYLRQVSPGNFLLGGRTSLGTWLEFGNTSGSQIIRTDNAYPVCLSGGLLVETPFGPLLAGLSLGHGGHTRAFFSLGRFLY